MQTQSGFELIQSFLVVAEKLNFRRAAERLNIDQSALSRRIRKLEDMLGFALFERTTRDVSLTPAGRTFYDENVHLLTDYSKSIEKARLIAEGKTGVLRIAHIDFATTRLIPLAVASFLQAHPYVDIRLRSMCTPDQKISLASVDLILCDVIRWENYRQRLDELFAGEGVQLHYCFNASNKAVTAGLVAVGMGVAIFPKSLAGFLGPDVELRPIAHPDFFVQIILVWRRSNRTMALRNFVDVAKSIYPR